MPPKPNRKKLQEKREKVIQAIVQDYDATKAVEETGLYKENTEKLMSNPSVIEAIKAAEKMYTVDPMDMKNYMIARIVTGIEMAAGNIPRPMIVDNAIVHLKVADLKAMNGLLKLLGDAYGILNTHISHHINRDVEAAERILNAALIEVTASQNKKYTDG